MSRAIPDMRNLGPRMAVWLAEIGVENEADFRAMGSREAWHRLRFVFGRQVSIIALYAMEASLRDCDWQALPAAVKASLRQEALTRQADGKGLNIQMTGH